ncbi:MAG: type II/IV secretion system protein [bacterium]|nr:type II/IV secretion system protein [bacterium]
MLRSRHIVVQDNLERDVRILIDDQTDVALLSFAQFCAGVQVTVESVVDGTLEQLSNSAPEDNVSTNDHSSVGRTEIVVSDSKVVRQVDDLISAAIASKASDIHFEPGEQHLVCRFRIDGMLVQRQIIERALVPEVLSRLKIMAGLDIAERRRPQDGRIRFLFETRQIDIRVSVVPTEFGEKAVLRLLDKAQLRLDLAGLGFGPSQLALFTERTSVANGIVLVTGPTGSGKTTTLYATLTRLKTPQVNISTVEDPIEYHLPGINQTQVKPEIGLTFSAMLRALLRQDPNIIMVGEIRDAETLEIALRASMTGHLVLSTIHTNSAVATIARMLDMGAEPSLLGSALRLIVAQRLVRLNCPHCKRQRANEAELALATRFGYQFHGTEAESIGCDKCNQTGFAGRQALYELLPITDKVRDLIHSKASESTLVEYMRTNELPTLMDAGYELVSQGQTTFGEVVREINC